MKTALKVMVLFVLGCVPSTALGTPPNQPLPKGVDCKLASKTPLAAPMGDKAVIVLEVSNPTDHAALVQLNIVTIAQAPSGGERRPEPIRVPARTNQRIPLSTSILNLHKTELDVSGHLSMDCMVTARNAGSPPGFDNFVFHRFFHWNDESQLLIYTEEVKQQRFHDGALSTEAKECQRRVLSQLPPGARLRMSGKETCGGSFLPPPPASE